MRIFAMSLFLLADDIRDSLMLQLSQQDGALQPAVGIEEGKPITHAVSASKHSTTVTAAVATHDDVPLVTC